ncbi:MAG: alpha/beta fold hydrolase [Acidobacteriota bacterium]
MNSPEPQQMLLHYRLVGKIDSGGKGEAYLAEDTKLGRRELSRFSQSVDDYRSMLKHQEALNSPEKEAAGLNLLAQTLFFSHRLEGMEACVDDALVASGRAGSETLRLDLMCLMALKHPTSLNFAQRRIDMRTEVLASLSRISGRTNARSQTNNLRDKLRSGCALLTTHALRFGKNLHLHALLSFTLLLALALAVAPSAKAQQSVAGESRFTKLDVGSGLPKAKIHYVSYGKGNEALVLIHGWTMNVDNWRDQVPDFAKRNRVIAIDLPGHGQSDKPQITYSMDLFARAVDAVMRDAKVKRAVLVGHSMGTPIARQFYRRYPKKTIAIVVVDGALRPFGDKAMMDGFIAGFRAPTYRELVGRMFAGITGPQLPAEAQERIKASALNTPQFVLVSAMEGMADASIWGDDKINVPVLAIMAKNPFYGPNLEEFYHGLAPNLDFQMWDGVGHFIMMEKPKEFNEAVLVFLDKNQLLKK